MKRFLIHITWFAIVVGLSIFCVFSLADGTSDPFYKRFTTPRQTSLVLGSSRAAHGIIPSIISEELKIENGFNYAFTYNTSPYGEVYLNSIKKKLDTTSKNQLFILGVDPWVLSNKGDNPNDIDQFLEKNNFLGDLETVNSNPNFEYLIKSYSDPYIKILYNNTHVKLEDDGYLRTLINPSIEKIAINKGKTLEKYKRIPKLYKFSELRMSYLKETVNYFQEYGDVYLVRIPIDLDFLELEDILKPDFDELMNTFALQLDIEYFNFSKEGNSYSYSDGHHLLPDSAKELSLQIANKIKQSKE
ncbi:hypothetical protein [Psychroserpens sp. Hel_I_66]|uniref:hypothetical protein n=1 Tax=Psychroserpens sp. Hel_I_66 TaxID=1250004 RepID=UPI000646A81B|nr:hypothetical protein [Psychroserpens sp. Hel_I_66]